MDRSFLGRRPVVVHALRQAAIPALFAGFGGLLLGCPVYGTNQDGYRVCSDDQCFQCPTQSLTSDCMLWYCEYPSDCPSDASCLSHACVFSTPPADASVPPDAPFPGKDGGPAPVPDAGPTTVACLADTDCKATGSGSRCLNGTCAAIADQCTDASHCGPSQHCLDGACVTSCSLDADAGTSACPTGYACSETSPGLGTCAPVKSNCGPKGPSCVSPLACVEGRCVAGCATTFDCKRADLVCVKGGCVVDEKPHFTCASGSDGKTCGTGVCLRRSCYTTCSPTGSDAGVACVAPQGCSTTSVAGKTVSFCGPADGLGSECAPGKTCLTGSCFDGSCL